MTTTEETRIVFEVTSPTGEMVVQIMGDGEVRFGINFPPQEAALEFWMALQEIIRAQDAGEFG